MKKIIVCGAGIGGMVSAILLAKNGNKVEIYEKNDSPGGKMNEFNKDGFRFDTGPSVITMPDVLRGFFKTIDRDINDYFELSMLDSSCKYFWQDGTVFDSFCNETDLAEELKNVFGEFEMQNFFKYMDYGKLFYDLTKDAFLGNEFNIKNYVSLKGILNLSKFISGRSVNDLSNKFFKNEKLKQLMDRYAAYNGSSPYLALQLFSIIPYIENKFGSWYVKGGIYNISRSLEKLCGEFNVSINYGHELIATETNKNAVKNLQFKTSGPIPVELNNFDICILNFTNNKQLLDEDYFKNMNCSE